MVSEPDVKNAVIYFPDGSVGGLDGLTPQHLKDLIRLEDDNFILLHALTVFYSLVFESGTTLSFCQYLFGANLIAYGKKGDGVHIAVVCTLAIWLPRLQGSW